MLADDLPWPELGNVSRGATRGNQGQKGVLSAPDAEGRCLLQLRVQPGVLTVLLNSQASDWYRRLDSEVNHALKLTKTYWRKARRRQDYDAVADQDHMELHEWLQQLKDKVMSHLELLMQRGDIKGPPYIMPENIELSFLRKFNERQAAGIPHNPRLRKAFQENRYVPPPRPSLADSETPEPSESGSGRHCSDPGWADDEPAKFSRENASAPARYQSNPTLSLPYQPQAKPHIGGGASLEEEAESSKRLLHAARSDLRRAQKDTQDAFARYTASLEAERRAWQEVVAVEDRRDNIVSMVLRQGQRPPDSYRKQSFSSDSELPHYSQYHHPEYQLSATRPHTAEHPPLTMRSAYAWDEERYPEQPRSGTGTDSPRTASSSPSVPEKMAVDQSATSSPGRKHPRLWDQPEEPGSAMLPPRKRSNHGSHTNSPALQPQGLAGHF